jgi:hypothetical protein
MSTGNYLVVHYGSAKPCIIEKGTEKYQEILNLLNSGATDDAVISALDIGLDIQKYSEGNFQIESETGTVKIDGQVIQDVITNRIIDFYKQKLPYLPLVNFWRNITQNPSEESQKHLYLFLEANKMPITHDGCFIGYKKVMANDNGDLVDCYSKTFCNNVGAVVVVDRANVDPDRNQTCSRGLHVAAFDYAANNYSGSHLLEVKVNPKDVVAVPTDYSNQKMRVCRYEVVAINKMEEIKKDLIDDKELKGKKKESKKQLTAEKSKIIEDKVKAVKALEPGSRVNLEEFSAKQIISIVRSMTDAKITLSVKNKKAIVKKAYSILTAKGYTIPQ